MNEHASLLTRGREKIPRPVLGNNRFGQKQRFRFI